MPLEGRSLSSRQRLGSESEEIDPMGLRTSEKIGSCKGHSTPKRRSSPSCAFISCTTRCGEEIFWSSPTENAKPMAEQRGRTGRASKTSSCVAERSGWANWRLSAASRRAISRRRAQLRRVRAVHDRLPEHGLLLRGGHLRLLRGGGCGGRGRYTVDVQNLAGRSPAPLALVERSTSGGTLRIRLDPGP